MFIFGGIFSCLSSFSFVKVTRLRLFADQDFFFVFAIIVVFTMSCKSVLKVYCSVLRFAATVSRLNLSFPKIYLRLSKLYNS